MAFKKRRLTPLQKEVRALKAQLPLAKPQRLKLEQKTAAQLMLPTDNAFSKYIRLRDSEFNGREWVGQCITCDRPLIVYTEEGKWVASSQNGHFISRGVYSLRFDELNTNLQCAHCNAWRDKEDMLERYRRALDLKYGEGTHQELKRLSKLPEAYKRPPKPTLLEIIRVSKEYVEWTLTHAQN